MGAPSAGSCKYGPVMTSRSELSSLSTSLDELARRLSAFAEEAAANKRDDLALELFEIERALLGASRRLTRLVGD